MLDGAGASTFLDIVDESNKEKVSTKNSTEIAKFKEIRSADNNDLPFINITRDKARKKTNRFYWYSNYRPWEFNKFIW